MEIRLPNIRRTDRERFACSIGRLSRIICQLYNGTYSRHHLLIERIKQQRGRFACRKYSSHILYLRYGSPFYRQFIANANAACDAGVQVEWATWFNNFLTQILSY
ncbi:hypothetical protein [Phocaeicola sp.]